MSAVAQLDADVLAAEGEYDSLSQFMKPLSKRAWKKVVSRMKQPLEHPREASPTLAAEAEGEPAVSAVLSTDGEAAPTMPTDDYRRPRHRDHIADGTIHCPAAVARPVSKAETNEKPKALEAKKKEWKKLVDRSVWRWDSVREWKAVAKAAREVNKTVNLGRLFGIMVEKTANCPRTTLAGNTSTASCLGGTTS